MAIDLSHPRFPRSNGYDPDWLLSNHMGPHPLWLLESLCEHLSLPSGALVLDLGCGKALTSVFLARELGVRVVAHDWWIPAEDNLARLREAGVAGVVTPIHAEAHALPFAAGQFDAIVSVDAYHYFGTADLYLAEMLKLLAPGGRLAVVVPGLREEPDVIPPPGLAEVWDWDFCSFHSPAWWRRHWEKTGLAQVHLAQWLDGGHELWRRWDQATAAFATSRGEQPYVGDRALLDADTEQQVGFCLLVASAS
jgi:SAM-dependent methyltransferase